MGYAIFTIVMLLAGLVSGFILGSRRNRNADPIGTERVDANIGELGKQQQSVTESITTVSESLATISGSVAASIDLSKTMGDDIQRAKDILAAVRERHKLGNP